MKHPDQASLFDPDPAQGAPQATLEATSSPRSDETTVGRVPLPSQPPEAHIASEVRTALEDWLSWR